MRFPSLLMLPLALLVHVSGCGFSLDYGTAAAHFTEDTVLEKGAPYLGKKIVVKGVVVKHDVTDSDNCMVFLNHSIRCNFGHLKSMAESCEEGATIYVSGILSRCNEGDIRLDPAMKRSPTAEFSPEK